MQAVVDLDVFVVPSWFGVGRIEPLQDVDLVDVFVVVPSWFGVGSIEPPFQPPIICSIKV